MKVLFVGDVMLGRLVNHALLERPAASPWGDTLPDFRAADLRVCNLECAISYGANRWAWPSKAFHFRTDEKNVASLCAAGIDIVSLANNHILDFGESGMARTIEVLDANGIGHAGAGEDFDQAAAPAVRVIDGTRVSLVAFTDNEPSWAAGASSPGTFYAQIDAGDSDAPELYDAIRRARPSVDLLIVSAHWGPNWGDEPPPEHVRVGRALIDSGADVVFGHSGHVVRGVEIYRQKPILYCAGDFVDDYAVDPIDRNDFSSIFILEAEGRRMARITVLPTVIRDFQALRPSGREARAILGRLQRLCLDLGTRTTINEQTLELDIEIPARAGVLGRRPDPAAFGQRR